MNSDATGTLYLAGWDWNCGIQMINRHPTSVDPPRMAIFFADSHHFEPQRGVAPTNATDQGI